MNDDKQSSSADRVRAHREREQEKRRILAENGLTEIRLLIKSDEFYKIKGLAKLAKRPEGALLYAATREVISNLCHKYDEVLINAARREQELQEEFIRQNRAEIDKLIRIEDEGGDMEKAFDDFFNNAVKAKAVSNV